VKSIWVSPVDFLLTARRDLEAAKRFFRKMLQEEPLLSPDRIGTDAPGPYPPAIRDARKAGLLARTPLHYVTKHLQQRIESDHFRVKSGSRSPHVIRSSIGEWSMNFWGFKLVFLLL
jgi:transposase-like protein